MDRAALHADAARLASLPRRTREHGATRPPGTSTEQAHVLDVQASAGNQATTQWLEAGRDERSGRQGQDDGAGGREARAVQRQRPAADPRDVRISQLEIRDHVRTYFDRQKEIGLDLVERKKGALEQFKEASSTEYNKEAEPSSLAILSFVLSLVPEAGAFIGVLKLFKGGAAYFEGMTEAAKLLGEGTKSLNEVAKGGVEVVKGAKEVGEAADKRETASEGQRRGDFIIGTVDTLAQLREETINTMWKANDQLIAQLDPIAASGVDLKPLLEAKMPLPRSVPTDAGKEASLRFELALYKDYFASSRLKKKNRVSWLETDGDQPFEEWLDKFEWPPKLMERIRGSEFTRLMPNVLYYVFGSLYEATPTRTRNRKAEADKRAAEARESRFQQGMEERLGIQ